MPTASPDTAVRNYLVSLKEPSALRDEEKIADLQRQLASTNDELERLQLRQQIIDAERPSLDAFEEEFTTHALAWAEKNGVTDKAFLAEGVPPAVLRKAGFKSVRAGSRRRGPGGRPRTRVSADEVRASIPKGTFTVKQLQEASGASAAVVRRIVQEEVDAGNVTEEGADPDHRGPGRSPILYKRL